VPILTRLQDGTGRMLPALGCQPAGLSGQADRARFLIGHPPSVPISETARRLKGRSAHMLRRKHPELRCIHHRHLWSPGHFTASVSGAPIDVLRRYIENQDRPT
jgi:putative transposase